MVPIIHTSIIGIMAFPSERDFYRYRAEKNIDQACDTFHGHEANRALTNENDVICYASYILIRGWRNAQTVCNNTESRGGI